ncbi:MAG: nucleotide-diphospho-sugar transferase [Campylobacterota bacterium]|nr:nucleotide-diphospho-sugar transferase [Campylobacterota bacterium]
MIQENNSKSSIKNSTFIPPHPLNTAVLFLVFNRLDTTKQVFEAIRQAKPPRLYVAADGDRETREDEAEKVKAVREYIMQNIDWECEVKTLFREHNLGCKMAVSGAIDWFFKNEEMGVILEDDCLPSQSFFWFCEELLERYKDDMRIGQISGFNPLVEYDTFEDSYLYSKFGPIWGWASWRRVWKVYDVKMTSWPKVRDTQIINYITDSSIEKEWRLELFEKLYSNKIDTWDYQWSYAKLINSYMSIIPSKNMIKNIGFGDDATHTIGKIKDELLKTFELQIVTHPKLVVRNKDFDIKYLSNFVKLKKINSLIQQLKHQIKRFKR